MSNDSRPSPVRGPTPPGPCVMVVDDDPGVLGMLDESLRREGFSVRLAATGPEAIRIYRRFRRNIDVVLMDVNMPALDGPATLRALRAIEPDVRCCFMSGNLGEYREADLIRLGATNVIGKPFCMNEVIRVLSAAPRRGAADPPAIPSLAESGVIDESRNKAGARP
jgi:CheY-like chemotaxis protein